MEIVTYKSVGPIEFGMSSDQVIGVSNPPLHTETNQFGEDVLDLGAVRVSISPLAGVVEVGLLPEAHPLISGIEIFQSPWALRRLVALDGAPKEIFGFVVLLNLGITVTGLHDGDVSQRAVTAFAEGRWDRFKQEMKPFAD